MNHILAMKSHARKSAEQALNYDQRMLALMLYVLCALFGTVLLCASIGLFYATKGFTIWQGWHAASQILVLANIVYLVAPFLLVRAYNLRLFKPRFYFLALACILVATTSEVLFFSQFLRELNVPDYP